MSEVRATTRRLWGGLGGGEEENDDDETVDLRGKREWGKLDMILESFDITQAALAKYKVAGYPPDVLIEVPKTVCSTYEFHRANELIRLRAPSGGSGTGAAHAQYCLGRYRVSYWPRLRSKI